MKKDDGKSFDDINTLDPSRRHFLGTAGTGALLLGLGGLAVQQRAVAAEKTLAATSPAHDDISGTILRADTVVADPTRLPPPIQRAHSIHHEIALEAREVRASLDSGIEFMYMTWDGQVPGPMIRVRQGDTVTLTVTSAKTNFMPHNVDMHAIYGTGGGAYGQVNTSGNFTLTGPNGVVGQVATASNGGTQWGWTAGAGLEYAFAPQWSFKTEYLYVDLGRSRLAATNVNDVANGFFASSLLEVETRLHTMKAGVNYRF